MSVHVSSWVWRNTKTLRAEVRLVLVRLADMANDDGEAFPSITRLAEDVNKSSRQVIRDINALEKLGLLAKSSQVDRVGRTTSNLYRIVMEPQAIVGRVTPTSPTQGDTHVTLTLTPMSPSGCHPCHPPKGESSKEPSKEPTTPLSPRSGGAGSPEATTARPTQTADEVERRIFAEHGVRLPRKVLRAIRHRIRVGETVEAMVADYAPQPTDWTPPSIDPTAAKMWAPVVEALRQKLPEHSFATWIHPLAPVAFDPGSPGVMPLVAIAAPSRPFFEDCDKNYGRLIADIAQASGGVCFLWWDPRTTSITAKRRAA